MKSSRSLLEASCQSNTWTLADKCKLLHLLTVNAMSGFSAPTEWTTFALTYFWTRTNGVMVGTGTASFNGDPYCLDTAMMDPSD